MEVFSDSSWIRCIKKFKRNPSVKDSWWKRRASLVFIRMDLCEGLCTIYLPRYWNQKLIDVFLKISWIMSINSINTLQSIHNYSNTNIPILKLKVLGTLEVEIIFIWITRKNDIDYFKEGAQKKLQGRDIEVNPEYTWVVKSFKNINIDLENSLSC
ncbi:unnamed protein product [Rhizophagus irregularis]|nr:unnamed protein product [Rhizophagus irregularis]